VYLGDTARVPYGTKSGDVVRRYADKSAGFLVERGAKLLVVACNTASAYALESLRSRCPFRWWELSSRGLATPHEDPRASHRVIVPREQFRVAPTKVSWHSWTLVAGSSPQHALCSYPLPRKAWLNTRPPSYSRRSTFRRSAKRASMSSFSDARIIRCCALPSSACWATGSSWWTVPRPWQSTCRTCSAEPGSEAPGARRQIDSSPPIHQIDSGVLAGPSCREPWMMSYWWTCEQVAAWTSGGLFAYRSLRPY